MGLSYRAWIEWMRECHLDNLNTLFVTINDGQVGTIDILVMRMRTMKNVYVRFTMQTMKQQ